VFLSKFYFYCTLSRQAEFPNYPKYCLSETRSAPFISDNWGCTVFHQIKCWMCSPHCYVLNKHLLALMAHIFAKTNSFCLGIALVAQCTSLVADKTQVCQFLITHFTTETTRMPVGIHGLDHSTNYKLSCKRKSVKQLQVTRLAKVTVHITFCSITWSFSVNPGKWWERTLMQNTTNVYNHKLTTWH
jgi:hypothetical protein